MEVGSLTFHKLVSLPQDVFQKGRRETAYTTVAKPYSYMTVESLQQPLQKVKLQLLQQLYNSGKGMVNHCQLLYFLPLPPTQDQPEKVKYAPQTNDIWHPAFVWFYFILMVGIPLLLSLENLSNDNNHRFSPVVKNTDKTFIILSFMTEMHDGWNSLWGSSRLGLCFLSSCDTLLLVFPSPASQCQQSPTRSFLKLWSLPTAPHLEPPLSSFLTSLSNCPSLSLC